jgi:hypothetical protein
MSVTADALTIDDVRAELAAIDVDIDAIGETGTNAEYAEIATRQENVRAWMRENGYPDA